LARSGGGRPAGGLQGVGAPPLQRGTPGLSSWQQVNGRHYTAAFRFFRYNGNDDSFAGTQTASVDIDLSKDGQALTTTTTTNIFDANGHLILTRRTAGAGTRVD